MRNGIFLCDFMTLPMQLFSSVCQLAPLRGGKGGRQTLTASLPEPATSSGRLAGYKESESYEQNSGSVCHFDFSLPPARFFRRGGRLNGRLKFVADRTPNYGHFRIIRTAIDEARGWPRMCPATEAALLILWRPCEMAVESTW
jgi:hypothetical protein